MIKNGSIGIISFNGIKYNCHICLSPSYCKHITQLKEVRENKETPSFVNEIIEKKKTGSSKTYTKSPDSWKKISYTPNSRMQLCLRSHPFQYLEIEDSDICEFICSDTDMVTCIECNSELINYSSEIVSLFMKDNQFKCKGIHMFEF